MSHGFGILNHLFLRRIHSLLHIQEKKYFSQKVFTVFALFYLKKVDTPVKGLMLC